MFKDAKKGLIITVVVFVVSYAALFISFGASSDEATPTKEDFSMKISSIAYENNESIPVKYTCDGEDISPPLTISGVPEGTQSLALIFDDPDAPAGTANPGWVHWIVYDISPDVGEIAEGSLPPNTLEGINDWNRRDYGGPCPPSGQHRYIFTLYALDTKLGDISEPTKQNLLQSMSGHVLEQTKLTGLYQRT